MKPPTIPDYLSVNQAVNKGVSQLLHRSDLGRWKGFPTLAGESDIWVTGFVIAHINQLSEQEERIKAAQKFLLDSRQGTHGWSYSAHVPSDADSTAWCIMALTGSTEFTLQALKESKDFLWSHYVDKGIATYKLNSGIAQFIAAPDFNAIAGWTAPHPDVSIAAVLSDPHHKQASAILNWLSTAQGENGCIESYWWRSPLYTTTLLLRAWKLIHSKVPEPFAKKVLRGLKAMQLEQGGFAVSNEKKIDPFSTALALEAYVHLKDYGGHGEMHACANALLEAQKKEGDWEGDFILRIPAPYVVNPNMVSAYDNPDGGGNSIIKDQDGLFATTLSCFALNLYVQTNQGTSSKPSEV